jgi:hypothetical protein
MKFQTNSFRARIKPQKPHFLQKAITYQTTTKDAFKGQMRTKWTVFLPKLTLRYLKPCVMLHISNGNGSCLLRLSNIAEVESLIERLNTIIHSEKFYTMWERLDNTSDKILINKELYFNEELIDITTKDILELAPKEVENVL